MIKPKYRDYTFVNYVSQARIFSLLSFQNLVTCFLFYSTERSIPTHFLYIICITSDYVSKHADTVLLAKLNVLLVTYLLS